MGDLEKIFGATMESSAAMSSPVALALVGLTLIIAGVLLLAPRIARKEQCRDVLVDELACAGPSAWALRTFGTAALRLRQSNAEDEETSALVGLANDEDPQESYQDRCPCHESPHEVWDSPSVCNDDKID